MNPQVDSYLSKAKKWQEEMTMLRGILLDLPLVEEWKWGKPCYSFQNSNIVLIIGFKNYCSLLFCKGALLKDAKGLLVKAGENTQAARQIRFTDSQQIIKLKATLKAYFNEAIEAEKAGLKVEFKAITELAYPEEFQKKLDEDRAFKTAFEALTPGRRRAYNLYFSAPKQAKTREARVEKYRKKILKGEGLNDEYVRSKKVA